MISEVVDRQGASGSDHNPPEWHDYERDAGDGWQFSFGQGHATHLGVVTSEEHAVINPADGTVQSTVVLTAANGDQLFLSDMGTVSGNTFAGSVTFTGGTGRFEDASGTGHFNAVLAPDGVHFSATFEGSIEY